MIFVTIGTPSQGFSRLLRSSDQIAENTEEQVIMQIGHDKYKPKYATYFSFLEDFAKIEELCRTARVVVCHGGVGSILTALDQGTPVIAVPRRRYYGESDDDHQVDTVKALEMEHLVTGVYDIADLEKVLSSQRLGSYSSKRCEFVNFLRTYMHDLAANSGHELVPKR